MTQLTVIAKIQAKSGSEAVLHLELLHLIQPTLLEEGCLNYDLHRSIEDSTLFLFYENWASRVLWEQHMASEHISVFQKNTEGLVENWELLLMKPERLTS
ncbi:MAG: antibiotic biosynthesis monooxygenase [Leptolyngbyaceae cyanobacterium SM1_4_3]|nr:antibiotic biosynthesis monooxygenase [Leptolyngbyaceae cyanobacterium SM1_4_3]NJN90061.1 antibiotic biosynthesis monooxygenase [Leptolyngbyaceae cyanobacterium SL_5_14]